MRGGEVERPAADGTEVLRASTLTDRFGARADADRRFERELVRDATAGFAFKRMDLRLTEGRLAAAFFVALGFDFAFIAISRAEL